MSQPDLKQVQALLAFKQKELEIVLTIDQIRDTASDPNAMLGAIVNALADLFQTEICLIALLDRHTQEIALKAINDRSQFPITVNRALAEKAAQLNEITVWQDTMMGQDEAQPPELILAAVPIIIGENERLGALLLGRTQQPFTDTDLALLKTVESMVDSAVMQGYRQYDLQQTIKELKAIYQIDHIRDQGLSLDEMLSHVLQEICQAIDAEVGFTMLYNRSGQKLELRATTHYDLFEISEAYDLINQWANRALKEGTLICGSDVGQNLCALMCLPLILNTQIIGVLGVVNRHNQRGFTHADERLLTAIGSQIDTAIFERIEQRRLREVLGRSVDPRVMERLLHSPDVSFLQGERAVLSVLFGDLRGSTSLAERTNPELLVGFINHYLGQMTEVILAAEGTLDKFVGDEVMALFGAPFPQPDHALRAVRVGLQMQQAHRTVMEMWHDRGIEPAPMGIGIATGELIVGEMGSPQRSDFTVIGKAANLGARICSAAKPGEVLISQATYDLVQEHITATPCNGFEFKGVGGDITVYRVDGLAV